MGSNTSTTVGSGKNSSETRMEPSSTSKDQTADANNSDNPTAAAATQNEPDTPIEPTPAELVALTVKAGNNFVDALGKQDFDALEATLAPNVKFRYLVSPELFGGEGATPATDYLRAWFGPTKLPVCKTTFSRLSQDSSLLFKSYVAKLCRS